MFEIKKISRKVSLNILGLYGTWYSTQFDEYYEF